MKGTDDWGTFNETTERWSGMVSHLLYGEADLSVSIAADIPIRRKAVDFTFSTVTFEYAALFRKCTFSRIETALLMPFTPSLWLVICIWILSLTTIVYSLQCRKGLETIDWIIYPVGTICLKALQSSRSTRKLYLSLLLVTGTVVGFVLNAAYSAVLYTFLSLPAKGSRQVGNGINFCGVNVFIFGVRDEDLFLFEHKIQV